MIGSTISHYRILEELGRGGMGVVYKAEDTTLDRFVALKFLPAELSPSEHDKARFVQEAKVASSLNHPNVCTIHAIEEHEGRQFIVMEYVSGETLRQKIRRSPLKVDEAIAAASQIGAALQEAHARGIVHRDVKAENIMITAKNQIKVMDFGLAKLKGSLKLTRTSSTVGTLGYMAPEQLQGGEADARSDIFSLGVVLFEMLTGKLPFRGDHEAALMYSIVNEECDSVLKYRQDIPPGLDGIVHRSLEKRPEDRYQQADEMTGELLRMMKQPAGASSSYGADSAGRATHEKDSQARTSVTGNEPHTRKSPPRALLFALSAVVIALLGTLGYLFLLPRSMPIDSLAVLPFVNASGDPNTEYLSDGVTAGLINRLSELSDVKVMSRYSVARFKDGKEDPRAAGRLMGVASVLTGRLDIKAERLVVDVELLDVKDGRQLWGDRFDRDRADALTIEREIVGRISDRLRIRLTGNAAVAPAEDAALDPAAYDLYLRGRYIMLGTSDDGPARAQEFFRRAIELEPRLAVAYAGLGESYVNQAWLSSKDRGEMVPLAKAALRKAVELDAGLSETHVLAGDIALYFDWDWSAADASYQKAIETNPGSDIGHREYANFLLLLDRPDQAIAEARKAQSLDPLSVYATHQLGYCYLATGRLPEAATEFRKAIDLNPSWVWGNIKVGMTYSLMGDSINALAAMHRADELLAGRHPSPLAQDWLAEIAYLCGDPKRVRETLARLENQAKTEYVEPIALAGMCYRVGDYDRMHKYIQQGYEVRSTLMVYLLLQKRFIWKMVSDDPRYVSLLESMGFPQPPA